MFGLSYNFTGSKRAEHIDWVNPVATMYDDLAKQAAVATNMLKNDADADGIPDYLDLEQNTKPGYKVSVKGVTLDSDADGIPDTEDTDPYGFNQMLSLYYPAETFKAKTTTDVMKFSDSIPVSDFITLNTDGYGLPIITFSPDKYDVLVEQYPLLQQIARIMRIDTSVSVAIIGHADNNKPDLTQLTIAEKRALAVKRQLVKIYEIESNRILIFSERDAFVKKYKMQTEGLDRKAEFRLIRKQQ
jgi:OOP family OmpA-OmpF porin